MVRRFLILSILVLLAVAAWKTVRIWPHASALWARASELRNLASGGSQNLASPERLPGLREQLGDTRRDLDAIRREISPLFPLARSLGWLPKIGGDLAAAPALLEMAVHLCDAGWWGLLGAESVLAGMSTAAANPDQSSLEAALPMLAVSAPRFAEAQEGLARAQSARDQINTPRLSPRLARYILKLDRYLPALQAATALAQSAPALLGRQRPVTYLVLAQNNHELRPTGGFISGVGVIQLSQGKIISTTFQDSYQVDGDCDLDAHPPAPEPLRRYMWAPALVLRDANWSPDFPTTAQVVSSIYRLCHGTAVDGVVALDLDAVAALLQGLEPLQPEGYPEPVTSATLQQFLSQYWAAPLRSTPAQLMAGRSTRDMGQDAGDWWSHRKDFMADLLQAALKKVMQSPQSIQMGKLAVSMLEALRGRHLLLWMDETATRQALAAAEWDGAVRAAQADYLFVVDANVGFRKVNPNIQQSIQYQVDLGGASSPVARLTLRYVNQSEGSPTCLAGAGYEDSYEKMMQGCYWDYVRVYVPRGSQLLQVKGSDQAPQASIEGQKAVFSAFLTVAPGQTRELSFEYQLPMDVILRGDGRYRLLIQKQPGTADIPVQVSVSDRQGRLDLNESGLEGLRGTEPVRFVLSTDASLAWQSRGAGDGWISRLRMLFAGGGAVLMLAGSVLWRRGRTAQVATVPASRDEEQTRD